MQFAAIAKSLLDTLSGHGVLRAAFPILRLYAERNESPEARARFSRDADRLQRKVLFWRYAPPKYKGGLVLNLFGFQVFRYLMLNLRHRLRPRRSVSPLPAHLRADMARQGYAIWPDALDPDVIAEILEFFERRRDDRMNHFDDFSELVLSTSAGPCRQTDDYRRICARVESACHWKEFGALFTKRNVSISPYIAILSSTSRADVPFQADGQDTPHSDVCYPSFKVFFYLGDVDDGDAPFTYFRGSQRFGFARALQEYRDSIKYFWKAKDDLKPLAARAYAEGGGYPEAALTGKKGTSIVFNVQGIHRRGDFRKDRDRERKVLLIDFRQIESTFQRFAA